MTFEEFLKLIRQEVGYYCNDIYWRMVYVGLKDTSVEYIRQELPFMAVHAITTDLTYKYG